MKFLKILGEIALELVLSLIMFFIGWGILSLFGAGALDTLDPELAIFIGSVIFLAVFFAAVLIIHRYIGKRR